MRIKINVPDKLSDVTLEQYQEFLNIQDKEEDQYIVGSKMIEIFCKVPYGNIIEYRMSHINRISKTLTNLFKQEQKTLIRHFELDNLRYGFIPELDQMTFGEYVDLDTYFKNWDDMHKAMSVLYRPVTETEGEYYSIEAYDNTSMRLRSKKFLDMKAEQVEGALVFFWTLGKELLTTLQLYLSKKLEKAKQQLTKDLQTNGVGLA